MKTREELELRLKKYRGAEYIYLPDIGLIAWQVSSGENIEILFIEAVHVGRGYGKMLMIELCRKIRPFNSVYVFRRAINAQAGRFYRSLGFSEAVVSGLYKDEDAVLGVVSFETLKKNLGAE